MSLHICHESNADHVDTTSKSIYISINISLELAWVPKNSPFYSQTHTKSSFWFPITLPLSSLMFQVGEAPKEHSESPNNTVNVRSKEPQLHRLYTQSQFQNEIHLECVLFFLSHLFSLESVLKGRCACRVSQGVKPESAASPFWKALCLSCGKSEECIVTQIGFRITRYAPLLLCASGKAGYGGAGGNPADCNLHIWKQLFTDPMRTLILHQYTVDL